MSRTIRNSWSWVKAHGPEVGTRDRGCGSFCPCKADRKVKSPARDRKAPQFHQED